jgi:8-oxo-dGTP pyrophosphatase MutT (NUDIX family)
VRYFKSELDECFKRYNETPRCGAIVNYKVKEEQEVYLFVKDRRTGKEGFPKGKLEAGESLEQCAVRETKE